MLRPALLLALILSILPSNFPVSAQSLPDQATFVTRLGADTLVVERFIRTETGMAADVVLRIPRTTYQHYELTLTPDGSFRSLSTRIEDPLDGSLLREETLTLDGDQLHIETQADGETRTETVTAHGGILPFIDMVHWPFELMLIRAKADGGDGVMQDLLSGGRAQGFEVRPIGPDSMTVKHPFRGTMRVHVDEHGRLLALDASATTRKLLVERRPWMDIKPIAQAFARRDRKGRAFGDLSGRGETVATVGGATIKVDFGQPSKRGREIFGNIVRWNTRWRTGANRATHFETDRALTLGDIEVPPGQYTLYTIPEPTGGTLIVNQQTGQGGTTYNQDQDLGRTAMTHTALDEPVEAFTIRVEDTGNGSGKLRLVWDRSSFDVPFTVHP